jgi:hypothetical protein
VRFEQDRDPATGTADAICWQRTQPIAETFHGVYCVRTNGHEWDESTLCRTYTKLIDLEAVFRWLKSELGLHPVYYHKANQVSGHDSGWGRTSCPRLRAGKSCTACTWSC